MKSFDEIINCVQCLEDLDITDENGDKECQIVDDLNDTWAGWQDKGSAEK